MSTSASCLFCKIISGAIPSYKLIETTSTFSFLDINPLSRGHVLVVPKHHAERLHQLPDDTLADVLPVAKKIAKALGAEDGVEYNVLQNNGRLAHQEIDHVHFHVIPKPSHAEGLGIGWTVSENAKDKEALSKFYEELKGKL